MFEMFNINIYHSIIYVLNISFHACGKTLLCVIIDLHEVFSKKEVYI